MRFSKCGPVVFAGWARVGVYCCADNGGCLAAGPSTCIIRASPRARSPSLTAHSVDRQQRDQVMNAYRPFALMIQRTIETPGVQGFIRILHPGISEDDDGSIRPASTWSRRRRPIRQPDLDADRTSRPVHEILVMQALCRPPYAKTRCRRHGRTYGTWTTR